MSFTQYDKSSGQTICTATAAPWVASREGRYEQAPARLQRSELAVPGSNPGMFEKAARSAADFIFLDCEDAVIPEDKPRARKNIIEALNDVDWQGKTMSVRINGLDTHYMYRDVVDIVEQAGANLDTVLIPRWALLQTYTWWIAC